MKEVFSMGNQMRKFAVAVATIALLLCAVPAHAQTSYTWDSAESTLEKAYGWSAQTADYSTDYYVNGSSDMSPDNYIGAFLTGDSVQAWLSGFNQWLPTQVQAELRGAEQDYNALTGSTPMIPGVQYVQDNGDGSFTLVVTYNDLTKAEAGYNTATYGGQPFVTGKRYVQNDYDGTYKVVVRDPQDY